MIKNKFILFHDRNLRVIDLANMIVWKDVKRAWEYHYPDFNVGGYKKVFEQIQGYGKKKRKNVDERFEVYVAGGRDWKNGLHNKKEIAESLKIFGFEEYYGCGTNKFSLSFRDWKEVCNLLVSKETLKNHTIPEILAHFIWELTWHGNEAQTKKKGKEMFKRAKEVRKDIAKGKLSKENFVSLTNSLKKKNESKKK